MTIRGEGIKGIRGNIGIQGMKKNHNPELTRSIFSTPLLRGIHILLSFLLFLIPLLPYPLLFFSIPLVPLLVPIPIPMFPLIPLLPLLPTSKTYIYPSRLKVSNPPPSSASCARPERSAIFLNFPVSSSSMISATFFEVDSTGVVQG
jgi:hypothetical protein